MYIIDFHMILAYIIYVAISCFLFKGAMMIKSEDFLTRIFKDSTYDLFRSEMKHLVKESSKEEFIRFVLQWDIVGNFWKKNDFNKALYVLTIFDIFTKELKVPLLDEYEKYRQFYVKEPVFPDDILMMDKIIPGYKDKCYEECKNNPIGYEFLKHNLVERDIYDVV